MSEFNWTCPLLPTDFVWEEGRIWGLSLPLCGISGNPMAQLEVLCGSNPRLLSAQKPQTFPQHLHRSAAESLQVSPTLPGSVRGACGACWNQLWSQGRVNSTFPKALDLWCTCRPSVQCTDDLLAPPCQVFSLSTIPLPGFCRKKSSSSGLEKEPKEKDLIWTLTIISAVTRIKFLNLSSS